MNSADTRTCIQVPWPVRQSEIQSSRHSTRSGCVMHTTGAHLTIHADGSATLESALGDRRFDFGSGLDPATACLVRRTHLPATTSTELRACRVDKGKA